MTTNVGEIHRVEILLVEDNPGDAELFKRLVNGRCNVTVASNGPEAFDRLFQRGRFQRSPRPHLLVVDINVPMLSGHEILGILKGNSALSSIPAIVWSGSDNEKDVEKAYAEGACAFITKKSGLAEMEKSVSAFVDFWCKEVLYPGLQRTHGAGNSGIS